MAVDETVGMAGRLHLAGSFREAAQDNGDPRGLLECSLMNLTGDPEGLATLKSFQEGNRDYLKFLIQEARTVFEHQVDFKNAKRSEEHTSELQSLRHLVCRLLLEKKKKQK